MPRDLIEAYLEQLVQSLRSRGVLDARIVDEARAHLIDLMEAGIRRGENPETAERDAIAAFGDPTVVASAAAAGARRIDVRPNPLLTRLLAATCGCTLLATAYLTLSVVVLRPPRLNYDLWFVMAGLFVGQSLTTLGAIAGWWRGGRMRTLLLSGSGLMVATGAWWVDETLSGAHFEGYALVLGTWTAIQGLLTVLVVVPIRADSARLAARTTCPPPRAV